MKSEKAEAILSRSCNYAEFFEAVESVVPYLDADSAVEQAEADRDAKAVEAHRTSCESFYQGGCCGPHVPCTGECSYMKRFIQKLNEE